MRRVTYRNAPSVDKSFVCRYLLDLEMPRVPAAKDPLHTLHTTTVTTTTNNRNHTCGHHTRSNRQSIDADHHHHHSRHAANMNAMISLGSIVSTTVHRSHAVRLTPNVKCTNNTAHRRTSITRTTTEKTSLIRGPWHRTHAVKITR